MPAHEGRVYVVTGADSEIGDLTAQTLEDRGARVIRCGLSAMMDVRANLGTESGRDLLVQEIAARAPGGLDGLALVADHTDSSAEALHVNYFGTLSVLAGLRPLLRRKGQPRVVIVSSAASLAGGDDDVITSCLRGDEETAAIAARHALATGRGGMLYRSSKIALNRWVRQSATADEWAGTGVVVNVVAPGVVESDEIREQLHVPQDEMRMLSAALPQPLGFPGPIRAVADAISWMISVENSFMAGQIVFIDGGADAALRSDRPYADGVRYGPGALSRMLFWGLRARVATWRRR